MSRGQTVVEDADFAFKPRFSHKFNAKRIKISWTAFYTAFCPVYMYVQTVLVSLSSFYSRIPYDIVYTVLFNTVITLCSDIFIFID